MERVCYENDIEPMLDNLGYSGKLAVGSETRKDGVAIFYKREKFNLKEYRPLLLNDLAKEQSPGLLQLLRNAGACAMVLESGGNFSHSSQPDLQEKSILVCTAHISNHYWQPDIPCFEIGVLIKKLTEISSDGIVFCGDFNSQPTSPMYKILSKGKINKEELSNCPLYKETSVEEMWKHNVTVWKVGSVLV